MKTTALWGEEFILPTKDNTKKILNKAKNPKTPIVNTDKILKSKNVSIEDKLAFIYKKVHDILGVYEDQTIVLESVQDVQNYLDAAKRNNVIAIDTETNNSLDPLTCKLMGLCLYTPGQKNAYVPVNHIDLHTGERLSWQVTEQELRELLPQVDNVFTITHNGSFDYEVLKCTTGWEMDIDWDTMAGARLLDENERAGLKIQYVTKIDPSIEKYSIEGLFEGIDYAIVDPRVFALYAATDSFMTYKLQVYQKEQFSKAENKRLFNLFKTVEIPILKVAAEMELKGITIDKDYASRLSHYYNERMADVDGRITQELQNLKPQIDAWRLTLAACKKNITKAGKEGKSKSEQLKDPVEVTSPTQLAILIYDILKLPTVNKSSPRSTGEEDLQKLIKHGFKLGELILKKRGLAKLINTYVDKIPAITDEYSRLHGHFKSLGTGTGRFSSSEPNLQNIPSHELLIRMMFAARPGYTLVGSDFSQQEPRLLAHYANDKAMIDAYKNKRDLYATIAAQVYNNEYWDNMEHYEDGTPNPEGKKRRSNCKSIAIGLLYGRGIDSVAEQIGTSYKEAEQLVNRFFDSFPTVKNWIEDTQQYARKYGYVEDVMGRRRRLPDIQLKPFEVETSGVSASKFNPLLHSLGTDETSQDPLKEYFEKEMLAATSFAQRKSVKEFAAQKGVKIRDNMGFIKRAERQCVNARVQGGAATITKLAMIDVFNDPILKNLGFDLLLCIHDELIGECPRENSEAAAERLSELMIAAAAKVCSVPMKCDATITSRWYEEEATDSIHERYRKLGEEIGSEKAFSQLLEEYQVINPEYLRLIADGKYECGKYDSI